MLVFTLLSETARRHNRIMASIFEALRSRVTNKHDFLQKVQRQRPGNPFYLIVFLLVVMPIAFLISIPATLIALFHRCFCRPTKQSNTLLNTTEVFDITSSQAPYPTRSSRPIDVVVLGATGLAGGLLAEYLLTEHPSTTIAFAGRSKKKLEAVRQALQSKTGVDTSGIQLIVADAFNLTSLFDMCRQAKVIATTVGPFKRFGNLVYHACAHSGTAYADITGEPDWVKHMSKIYDSIAKKNGASLVSYCGVDSVPSEMGATEACAMFQETHGGDVDHVETVVTRFKGGIPAGTFETVVGIVDGTDVVQLPPLNAASNGKAAAMGTTKIVGLFNLPNYSAAFNQWTIPFFMGSTNAAAVRSSNSLVGFAPNIKYTERWGFPDFTSALLTYLSIFLILPIITLPLLRKCGRAIGMLPKAGAGSAAYDEKVMLNGSISFLVAASGKDNNGQNATTALRVSGLGDAGGAFTAVCHGSIAVLLADTTKTKLYGAGLTPVATLGKALSESLLETGLIFLEPVLQDDKLLK